MTLRSIRRLIWTWLDWRARQKLDKAIPGHADRRQQMAKASRQHRPSRAIQKAQRDAVTAALTGRG